MNNKQFLSLEEVESLMNDPDFYQQFDDENCPIDIVVLPPDKVDVISDE